MLNGKVWVLQHDAVCISISCDLPETHLATLTADLFLSLTQPNLPNYQNLKWNNNTCDNNNYNNNYPQISKPLCHMITTMILMSILILLFFESQLSLLTKIRKKKTSVLTQPSTSHQKLFLFVIWEQPDFSTGWHYFSANYFLILCVKHFNSLR